MKVEIYSDVACPWCYVGTARFERALAEFPGRDDVQVVFRSYQLDPAAPFASEPMYDYLARRFGGDPRAMTARVVELARGEGLAMDFERGRSVNTLLAHRLLWQAEREHGPERQRAVAEALFRAHFAEGRDVGDVETLVEIAAGAGMDAEGTRAVLQSSEGTRAVQEAIAEAQRLGITAVPTFVFEGRWAVQGAQATSTFAEALAAVARETGDR